MSSSLSPHAAKFVLLSACEHRVHHTAIRYPGLCLQFGKHAVDGGASAAMIDGPGGRRACALLRHVAPDVEPRSDSSTPAATGFLRRKQPPPQG
ncbi:unnamed protein product [Arctogadus glacialis]